MKRIWMVAVVVCVGGVLLAAAPAALAESPGWSAPASIDSAADTLHDVSCVSATFCMAVDGNGDVIQYNGERWSAPSRIDTATAGFNHVSCATATFCVAIDARATAWMWNGSTWSGPSAQLPGSQSYGDTPISCTADPAAVANQPNLFCAAEVGSYLDSLVNGTWSGFNTMDAHSDNFALSCTENGPNPFCIAIDAADNGWTLTGSNSWSENYPGIDTVNEIDTVSCATVVICVAADISGDYTTFTGSGWTTPASVDDTSIWGVSCVPFYTTARCFAIDNNGILEDQGNSWGGPNPLGDNLGESGGGVTCAIYDFCVAWGINGTVSTFAAPTNTVKPTIVTAAGETLDRPAVGQTLTAGPGTWTNDPSSYGYEWNLCNSAGGDCSAIPGATAQTYTPTAADRGRELTVTVSASSQAGFASASSAPTGRVVLYGKVSVGTPATSGTQASIPVKCGGSAGAHCTITATMTVTGSTRKGLLRALAARSKAHVVGTTTVRLTARRHKLLRVALNATGRRLLKAQHTLAVRLTLDQTVGTKTQLIASKTLRFKS